MESKLTKAEIVGNIAEATGYDRNEIHNIINCLIDEMKGGLEENKTIELRGFGTFEVRTRKGRERARNPKTGDIVSVPDHCSAVFRAGKELKTFLWDKKA